MTKRPENNVLFEMLDMGSVLLFVCRIKICSFVVEDGFQDISGHLFGSHFGIVLGAQTSTILIFGWPGPRHGTSWNGIWLPLPEAAFSNLGEFVF